jgi:hypothetical protein
MEGRILKNGFYLRQLYLNINASQAKGGSEGFSCHTKALEASGTGDQNQTLWW